MKKFLLLSVAAVALSASAMSSVSAVKSFELGATKHSMTVGVVNTTSNVNLYEDVNLAGTYVAAAVSEDPVNSCGAVVIEANATAANSYTVKGALIGVPDVAVNASFVNGKFVIPAGQQVYSHPNYGPACLFAMDEENVYDLVFSVKEDGSLTLDGDYEVAMILVSGSYAGYALGNTYSDYCYKLANGTCTFDAFEPTANGLVPADPAVETYNTCVELTKDEVGNVVSGAVYGFDDMTWLPFTVGENNKVQFSTDKVYYYSSSYGLAFACDTDDSGSISLTAGPTGTIDVEAGTISMPFWTFILPTTGSRPTYYILNSVKKNCVVTFPVDAPTAVADLNVTKVNNVRKFIENGQVVIVKDNVKYNVAGQVIK